MQDLARDLPRTDRLPRSRVLALARFAAASKAQAIARLPEERRIATLLAFVRTLEASAQDDVLDLFDVVVTRIFADAEKREREARLRSLRDLDAAALVLRDVCAPVLPLSKRNGADTATDPAAIDARPPVIAVTGLLAAIAAAAAPEAIEAAMARVDALVRPPDHLYVDELLASTAASTRFLPALARTVRFGANPAEAPVLDAVAYLRDGEAASPAGGSRRSRSCRRPGSARSWRDGAVDRQAWTMCLVERMRQARAPPRPLRRASAALRRPADRAAGRSRLGSGPPGGVPHARPRVRTATAEVARLAERLDAGLSRRGRPPARERGGAGHRERRGGESA